MRLSAVFLIAATLATTGAPAQTTPPCTGLCLQQNPPGTCGTGGTTSISGTVYAPNGTDPLPNVQVYIPNDVVAAFTPGVACPVVGAPPSGSPLVGTTTATDGTFTITNVPVGANIPLVIVSGRWRRQIVIPATTSCANTVVDPTQSRFPRNQTEGDIPLFAIATGGVDSVECVLRKVGIADSEFTDPSGGGRIQFYTGGGGPGTRIDPATPTQAQLMSSLSTLESYDVLMLPCQGNQYAQTAAAEQNFDQFVNDGGRVYSSHFSYVWMYYPGYTNGPFAGVANWQVDDGSYTDGTATINTGFSGGITLANWLQLPAINASTSYGQMPISTLKHDLAAPNGVNAPTTSWFTLNTTTKPVMQFVFDAPIAATNQCGRVLYNEYHVETASSTGTTFPNECNSAAPATPQEKLLEFMLFELTDQGGAATLTPTSETFPNTPVGFSSAPFAFSLTNNSTFVENNPIITTTGDFTQTNNCTSIPAGTSCTINVTYNPTVTGPETGTLSVGVGSTNLISTLTGTGVPDLTVSIPNLNFGSVDVGFTVSQTFTVTNTAGGAVGVSGITLASTPSGNFTSTTTCPALPNKLANGASCTDTVIFKPTTTGTITGTVSVGGGVTPSALAGNGIDFSFASQTCGSNPVPISSSTVIAGDPVAFCTLTSPIAGFANSVTLSCNTTNTIPGTTCAIGPATSFVPGTPVISAVTITTTSQYTVIGYGGFGSRGLLWIVGLASGAFLLLARRRMGTILRAALMLVLLAATTFALSGCSGKLPAKNAVYSAAGTYTGQNGTPGITITATDGFLVHSVTYSLTITAK